MHMHTSEQDLRREAIRRRLTSERRKDICHNMDRSTSWFDKWWAEYRANPQTDFADRSLRHRPHLMKHPMRLCERLSPFARPWKLPPHLKRAMV